MCCYVALMHTFVYLAVISCYVLRIDLIVLLWPATKINCLPEPPQQPLENLGNLACVVTMILWTVASYGSHLHGFALL